MYLYLQTIFVVHRYRDTHTHTHTQNTQVGVLYVTVFKTGIIVYILLGMLSNLLWTALHVNCQISNSMTRTVIGPQTVI